MSMHHDICTLGWLAPGRLATPIYTYVHYVYRVFDLRTLTNINIYLRIFIDIYLLIFIHKYLFREIYKYSHHDVRTTWETDVTIVCKTYDWTIVPLPKFLWGGGEYLAISPSSSNIPVCVNTIPTTIGCGCVWDCRRTIVCQRT